MTEKHVSLPIHLNDEFQHIFDLLEVSVIDQSGIISRLGWSFRVKLSKSGLHLLNQLILKKSLPDVTLINS